MTARESARSISAMSFIGVGFSFLAEVGACAGLGYWLDGKWGTEPWGLSLGVAIGMSLAIGHLLRAAARFEAQGKAEKEPDSTNEDL